eukprot:scaffold38344_cov59-Phaeocystis_antarctica.AAC.3
MHPKKRCTSSSGTWSALPKTSAAPPSACSSRHTSCPRTNERPSLSCACSSCVDVHKVTHPSLTLARATHAKVALSGGELEPPMLSSNNSAPGVPEPPMSSNSAPVPVSGCIDRPHEVTVCARQTCGCSPEQ